MTVEVKPEFTIKYWMNEADKAQSQAEHIADLIGESFSNNGDYGFGGWYTPDPDKFVTKEVALEWLASGRELTELEKYVVQRAIEMDLQEDDTEGWNSSAGWVSSSANC